MSAVVRPPQQQPKRPSAQLDNAIQLDSIGRPADHRKPDMGPTAPERRRWDNISYWAIGWLVTVHVAALAAPWTFTWTGLGVAVALHFVTGGLGICLGYHRLLTHTGMKTHPWVRYLFASIGSLAGEGAGSPIIASTMLAAIKRVIRVHPRSAVFGAICSGSRFAPTGVIAAIISAVGCRICTASPACVGWIRCFCPCISAWGSR